MWHLCPGCFLSYLYLSEETQRHLLNKPDKYFLFQVVWGLKEACVSEWESLLFGASRVIERSWLGALLCVSALQSSFCVTNTGSWHKQTGVDVMLFVLLICGLIVLMNCSLAHMVKVLFPNGKLNALPFNDERNGVQEQNVLLVWTEVLIWYCIKILILK